MCGGAIGAECRAGSRARRPVHQVLHARCMLGWRGLAGGCAGQGRDLECESCEGQCIYCIANVRNYVQYRQYHTSVTTCTSAVHSYDAYEILLGLGWYLVMGTLKPSL